MYRQLDVCSPEMLWKLPNLVRKDTHFCFKRNFGFVASDEKSAAWSPDFQDVAQNRRSSECRTQLGITAGCSRHAFISSE